MGKLVLKAAVGMLALWFPEWDRQTWRVCVALRYTTAAERESARSRVNTSSLTPALLIRSN